jgi:hypothetical protein
MKYIIRRTSGKPLKLENVKRKRVHYYAFIRKSFAEQNQANAKWFFDNYKDITVMSDDTLRGVSIKASNVYTIDIDIHELASIVHKELILIEPRCKEGLWEVEIYDYWRE